MEITEVNMITLTILVPIVVALTEAIKRAEFKYLDKKMMPFVAMVMAIGLAIITKHTGEPWTDALMLGITAGLASVGLFSSVKNVLKLLIKS